MGSIRLGCEASLDLPQAKAELESVDLGDQGQRQECERAQGWERHLGRVRGRWLRDALRAFSLGPGIRAMHCRKWSPRCG